MNPRRRSKAILAVPAIGYALLILAVSSVPGTSVPAIGVSWGDKLLHAAEYAVFGVLLLVPVRDLGSRGDALVLAVGGGFAALDEAYQTAVPGRFGDVADVAMDLVGLLLVVLAHMIARRFRAPPV
ncbi:MAG: VanZ family protein [Euryarchaeota archaeon]|nr:VanZ family protein [Euryarchaeota archaeon]